jgi:TonB family protein
MTLLMDAALRATVLLGAGWIAAAALRTASADLRRAVWRVTIAAVALLPILLAVPVAPALTIGADMGFAVPSAADAIAQVNPQVSWLPLVWAAGCAVVLLRLALGIVVVRRWSRAAEIDGRVGYSTAVATPLAWGTAPATILLPAEAREWTTADREAALLHEAAHVEHHDWAWQVFARVVAAVFWFHPLVWVAERGLRRESERATDDYVLRRGIDPVAYAAQLAAIARRISGPSVAAVAMAQVSGLEKRLVHVLRPGANRTPARRRAIHAMGGIAAVLGLWLGGVQAAQVHRVGDPGVTPPVKIRHVAPVYPQEAKDERIQGMVFLRAEISEAGIPEGITVLRSDHNLLTESAVEAVEQWRYTPGRMNGEIVRLEMTITVNFSLQ